MSVAVKFVALLSLCVVIVTSCVSVKPVYYKDDKAVALKAVEQVHQLFNDENYEGILQMFARQTEENGGERDQFLASMKKNRAERGRIVNYKETKYQLTPNASHRELLFLFTTEFEKGIYEEGFVVLVDGENAKLDGYFQSDAPRAR